MWKISAVFLILCAEIACSSRSRNVRFPFDLPTSAGRWVQPTNGEIWPKPQLQESRDSYMILRPDSFEFQVTGYRCDIIDDALRRYYGLIFHAKRWNKASRDFYKNWARIKKTAQKDSKFRGFLASVQVHLSEPCERLPSLEMDESYTIEVDTAADPLKASLESSSVWGILRGLESISQLIYSSLDGVAFQINATLVFDFPRFPHRGILIDSARHFLPVSVIKDNIDLMAQNKFNVFHWHLVDNAAFPYQSVKFPNLSRYGAFNEFSHVYTPADVREIIEFARLRGIRVVPEFDTPGHTWSWGNGLPGLLTDCYDRNGTLDGTYGPINPVRQENYVFLREFFEEVFHAFPEAYVHLGGDEVEYDCWESNEEIIEFMDQQGWGRNFSLLQQHYMDRLIEQTQEVTQNQMKYIVWQEVVDNNVTLRDDTVIHMWIGGENFTQEVERVTSFGYRTILSSPWYLNSISYGIDWDKYYLAEPLAFNGTAEQKRLVIGGEACMWGEYEDAVTVTSNLWPRACAIAERLWSSENVNDPRQAAPRLEEHRCRLLRRGFNVQPANGVGFCNLEWSQ